MFSGITTGITFWSHKKANGWCIALGPILTNLNGLKIEFYVRPRPVIVSLVYLSFEEFVSEISTDLKRTTAKPRCNGSNIYSNRYLPITDLMMWSLHVDFFLNSILAIKEIRL